ncbi:cobalt transporter CbiM [Lactiplantibacillus sp. WILCCON 0030]|uniref:Cobalt transporter CbiM n=1 Tax=Lactiplantibacillus brownii TaxID=3069269 RepID=A0ABU1A7T4_9LACO|nr:cobalt transporter CbiM [Lactiplantibacillus brownii]MDQ7936720.1 cobalt transporter CbiM [Lactiplantibacillus brownii]
MHIPDNYLSPATCGTLVLAVAPVWTVAVIKVKAQIKQKRETLPMLGIAASLAFLIMMFNLPIPGGTTAHAVGGALLAVLIGPWAAVLALTVTLLLQALLFGDGGILAFGANAFNMAVIMPMVGYACYRLGEKLHHPKIGLFVGAYVGINVAALVAGIELGLQPLLAHTASGAPLYCPYGLTVTVPAMLAAHLLVAGWVEAIFTVLVYQFIQKVAPTNLYQAAAPQSRRPWLYLLGGLVILSPLGLLASNTAWGEWSATELKARLAQQHLGQQVPQGMAQGLHFKALFQDYTIGHLPISLGYILSAITAILIFLLLMRGLQHDSQTTK